MPDAFLYWGGGLQWSPSGDLRLADGPDLTRQRIIRRLFTAVRAYVWHQDYGAGLPQKVGHLANVQTISALVRANISLEASVLPSPPPKIDVFEDTTNPGLFVITIVYTDADLNEQVTLSFDTTGQVSNPILFLG